MKNPRFIVHALTAALRPDDSIRVSAPTVALIDFVFDASRQTEKHEAIAILADGIAGQLRVI